MPEQPSQPADDPGLQPTEEELRAYEEQLRAFEEQLARIRVEEVLVQTVVTLLSIGARRGGAVPPAQGESASQEADLGQLRLAIEGVRALMPLVEHAVGEAGGDLGQLREALSQLQMAYAAQAGAAEGAAEPPASAPETGPQGPGPAQTSGRLWVPGQ